MRSEEWVTVQGPVKEQQPDGMSHGGWPGGSIAPPPPLPPSPAPVRPSVGSPGAPVQPGAHGPFRVCGEAPRAWAPAAHGRFGRQKVAQVLSGSQAQGMEEHMDLDSYAALGHLSQRAVLELVDDLMSDGLLERIGDQYPCVDLTAAGLEAVQQPRPPRAAAKRPRQTRSPSQSARRASSAPPTSGVPLDKRDLLQRLRDVRRDVAAARGLEPYKVCRDVLLEQLAELAPRSADDVGELKGLGPKTRQKVLPKLLKEVELWREQGGH